MQVVFAIKRKNIALTNNAERSNLARAVEAALQKLQKVAQPHMALAA